MSTKQLPSAFGAVFLCLVSMPGSLFGADAAPAPAPAVAAPAPRALPTLDTLKTQLTLSDAQSAAIGPILDEVSKALADYATANTSFQTARTDASNQITQILTAEQKPLFANYLNSAGARGGGRGGRGGAMSPEDQAKLAKLATLPVWKPGVGEGDYTLVPDPTKTPPYNDLTNPAYAPDPENAPRANVPKGKVVAFHLPLAGSNFYPPRGGGAAPEADAAAAGAAPLSMAAMHRGEFKGNNAIERDVYVYIPAGYVAGTPLPLLFCHDAMGMHDNEPAPILPDILDNMIADKRLPSMIAVMVDPSNNRSGEYDTVSGKYAEYVETEVLPRVAKECNVAFSKDPDARAVMGGSSGGAASVAMAWFHPELYHRVLLYSATLTSLRRDPETAPHGAWEYHENFFPKSPAKPLRIWLEVAQNDNGSGGSYAGMGNWIFANLQMAEVLKAKGYHYQFVYAPAAGHVDRPVRSHTLAPALEWLWKDYKPAAK